MEIESENQADAAGRLFVARQPIFNADKSIHAYEILFRSGFKNCFDPSVDQDYASGRTLSDTFMTFGIGELTGDRKAFINFTQKHLEEEVPAIFPNDRLVIEILESVEPTARLVEATRNLKAAGYTIALDDFKYDPKFDPLVELADLIKVDFIASDRKERAAMVRRFGGGKVKFLAEKVETNEEFADALEMGYTLFQGYFFAKPQILQSADIPGFKLNYMEMVREINSPEMNFGKVEKLVKRDLSLSYKFLRFMNSAHFGFPSEIKSINQALRVLGIKGTRTWLSLVALTALGDNKPRELVIVALIRALFMEKLAVEADLRDSASDLFMIGLFSVIDAILDRPMEAIVNDLPLSPEVKDALNGKENRLRKAFELMVAYERGDWQNFSAGCQSLGVEETKLPTIYRTVVTEAMAIERNFAQN